MQLRKMVCASAIIFISLLNRVNTYRKKIVHFGKVSIGLEAIRKSQTFLTDFSNKEESMMVNSYTLIEHADKK